MTHTHTMITTAKKKIIILIPYPAQGHVTPMLKLGSLLSNLGFRPVVVTPEFIHRRISPRIDRCDGIVCLPIAANGLGGEMQPDFFAVERAMEEDMPPALEQLVNNMILEDGRGGGGITCVVADVLASWAFDVARRCRVPAVGFWPAMHATYRLIAAIPHLISTGIISENGLPIDPNAPISLSPNESILTSNDLPWLIGSATARISRFNFWTRTLDRAKSLRCLLMNTFPDDQGLSESYRSDELSASLDNSQQVFEIGPLVMQAAMTSTASLRREDTGCLNWLDMQKEGSVLYVSFGSWVSPIKEAKVRTLALTLEKLKRPFIWVLGHAWRQGLPVGYAKRVAVHGRIVPWAPQVEVLRHPAVGCYLTHCGWNSTVEAVQCRKPLLCYPIAGDQFLNSGYIVSVWKIGVKIDGFDAKEVEDGIKKVVEDEEMSHRIERLNDKFFGKGGSSKAMANLSTFLQDLSN